MARAAKVLMVTGDWYRENCVGLPCQHQQGQSLVNSHRTSAELKPHTTMDQGPHCSLRPPSPTNLRALTILL